MPTSQIDSIKFARRASETPLKPKSKLAIEYLAQYNMESESSFATSHRNDASKYFSYQDACNRFATIEIDGSGWHLPSVEEWRGIIPSNESGEPISFAYTQCQYNVAEAIEIGGLRRSYLADYNSETVARIIGAIYCISRWLLVSLYCIWKLSSYLYEQD